MKLALLFFLISLSVMAREKGQMGLGLGVGPSFLTNPSSLEDPAGAGVAGGIWVKYTLSERLNLDLSYHRLDFSDITTYSNSMSIGGSYLLTMNEQFNPYVHFGIGGGTIPHNNRDSNGQVELMSLIGAGVEYQLSKKLLATLQADFHAFLPTGQNGSQLYALAPLIGITYFWDKTHVAAVPCVTEPPIQIMTSSVLRVDNVLDSDNDGIEDARDLCPKTKADSLVYNTGCGKEKKNLPKINVKFFAGKTTFTHYYHDQLKKTANLIKKDKNLKLVLTGHADKSGASKINQALAKARVETVKAYLVNKLAVNPDDVVIKSYGTSLPEASNKDPAGRSANRRVEGQFMQVITE